MANVSVQTADSTLLKTSAPKAPKSTGSTRLSGASFGQTLKSLSKPKQAADPNATAAAAAPAARAQPAKKSADAKNFQNDSSQSNDSSKTSETKKPASTTVKKSAAKKQDDGDENDASNTDCSNTSDTSTNDIPSTGTATANDSDPSSTESTDADSTEANVSTSADISTAVAQQAAAVNAPVPTPKPIAPHPDAPKSTAPGAAKQPATVTTVAQVSQTPTPPTDPTAATSTNGQPVASQSTDSTSGIATTDSSGDLTGAELAAGTVGPTAPTGQATKPASTPVKKQLPTSGEPVDPSQPTLGHTLNNSLAQSVLSPTPQSTAAVSTAATEDSSDDSSTIGKIDPTASDLTAAADPTALLNSTQPAHSNTTQMQSVSTPEPPRSAAEVAASNHDKIVTAVHGQLTPNGGTMKIRLDPPELGSLQVTVKMVNGAMTASFETSNSNATQMLSHSLSQLKSTLESSGVTVEKLHVTQTSNPSKSDSGNSGNNSDDSRQQSTDRDGGAAQREQQRREMIRRMWAKLGVGDPLDMVA